ncbi:TfoX/Sxy family protein [Sagittula stellata]|uniref:TfoX-like protein n=1 Tax=Sagittula stellata (strain ATCC 700073 / DSM 11524 / E-37) TaxID=388399 RepID=A3K1M9_SAGS3|nr:TfoX/Sxy family protein [Sagittula stellata]EBA08825.1 TfoX-like protein [Sagittula stellata E-37]
MALSEEDRAYARDLFSGLGDVTTRRMFGGMGIYSGGTIFALLMSDGTLMIKGAGAFADRLEEMGCERWRYTRKDGGGAAMPYWTLPGEALDDPDEAVDLAREALRYL